MLAIALILGLFSLGSLCRALFTLSVHAFPFFIAVGIGLALANAGTGICCTVSAGAVAGALIAATGRLIFAVARWPSVRVMAAAIFLVPAAIAGYHAVFGLAGFALQSSFWRGIAGCVSAVLVCTSAWHGLADLDDPGSS